MLNLDKKLVDEITQYCKLNEITDIDKFTNDLLKKAFTAEKFGAAPVIVKNVEKNPPNVLPSEENEITLGQIEPPKPKKQLNHFNANNNDDYKIYDQFGD